MEQVCQRNKLSKKFLPRRGFTLVELTIVMALTGFLLLAVFGSYFQIRALLLRQSQASGRNNQAIFLMKTLLHDLNTPLSQNWNKAQFFSGKKEVVGGKRADRLNFPAGNIYANPSGMQSAVYTVSYYSEPDDKGQLVLYRREDIFLDSQKREAGLAIPYLENLQEFRLEFSANGQNWVDEWNYAQTRSIPGIIRVHLSWLEPESSQARVFTFEVRPLVSTPAS